MEKYLPVLKECVLFEDLNEEEIGAALGCFGASARHYGKDDMILRAAEPAQQIGIVLSGSAQVERADYLGNRSIMAKLVPGQLFGEAFACAGVRHMPVSVRAVEDAAVLLLPAVRIIHACEKVCSFHAQLIYNLMRILAVKNLVCQRKIEVISQRTTREKLLCYLAMCAQEAGSGSFAIPFDRQELADYLEVDRSGLSAEISKLRKEGVLRCEKNRFELLQ